MATYVDGVYIHEKDNENNPITVAPSGLLRVETSPSPSGYPTSIVSASGTPSIEVYTTDPIPTRVVSTPGDPSQVSIVGPDGVYTALVTPAGRLNIAQEPPTPPPGTTEVSVTEFDAVTTTDDNVYTIPNGETITLQRLSGGAEQANSGTTIELWYDPNGDGTGMTIVDVIFSSANSDQHDLNESYTGDGTAAIRMRRRRLSGGAVQVFGRWEGYY
jgi:hypothetical protein